VRMLRELSRSYLAIVKDLSRVMNRLKAVYRSWAIPCAGRDVYYRRHRAQWLDKIREAGVRRRAERLYEQLDMLQHLRQEARRELLAESRKHAVTARLRQIPYLGPIRSALAVALMQTPHRFRPSDNCGLIAGWFWRPASVRNIAWWKVKCGAPRSCFPFGA
jgi:transposase